MAKLKEKTIIERWGALIDDCGGKGERIFEIVEQAIKERKAPKVKMARRMVSPSFFKMLQGREKPFLIVSNSYLKGYRMYVGATDYGKQLYVSWYLCLEPNKYLKMIEAMPWWAQAAMLPIIGIIMVGLWLKRKTRVVSPEFMDIFDMEELCSYVITVHHAAMDAAEEIAKEVDYDFTKVDRVSRGFLNVS